MENTNISVSMGEYLDAIYEISLKKPSVRTTDIAQKLGLSKPSVNRAVSALKRRGYVTHEPYGAVLLTDEGRRLSELSGRKHMMIKNFLTGVLNLSSDEAEKEAFSIVYIVSNGTVEKMNSYLQAKKEKLESISA